MFVPRALSASSAASLKGSGGGASASLLPSRKYTLDALRGAHMRFGGLLFAAAADLEHMAHARLRCVFCLEMEGLLMR
jgi:hypothetical protein